ncbi:hypothetical protein ACOMHN_029723 [Nucella lapillus]
MKLLLLSILALTGVSADDHQEGNTRIVGGEDADQKEHPYICSLQQSSWWGSFGHICGCVIYKKSHVITAAHCVDGSSPNRLRIQAGVQVLNQGVNKQTLLISTITMHSRYQGDAPGYPNDIAILTLNGELNFNNYVQAANIDRNSNSNWENKDCWLSGWGRTGGGDSPSTLQRVSMKSIANADCKNRWSNIRGADINDGHICFLESGKSACNGDSGGPVRCGSTVTGVTSWGIATCSGDYPSVYTRLGYYADWLKMNTPDF